MSAKSVNFGGWERKPGALREKISQKREPPSQVTPKKSLRNAPETDGRRFVASYVETYTFDLVIGIIIFLNAISIGVEQSLQVAGHDTLVCQIIESIFLFIYIVELGARLFAYGLSCFQDHWVKFDAFLVVIGIICSWIVEPFVDASPDELSLLMVLRVLRLLRLLKTARLFSQIQEFLRLVRAILDSTTIVMCALLLVFLIVYVFSSLGVELITKHKLAIGKTPDKRFQDQVEKYFSNLPLTMLTLLQFVTLDDMSSVYKPLIEKDPWLSLYFIILMVFLSIVLTNMVAAVIFSCILEQEQTERDGIQRGQEEELARLIRDLKDLFVKADTDGSGQVSKDELLSMDEKDLNNLKRALGVSTPLQIFNSLDVDGSGELNINEFFDGIWECALNKGSPDLKRLEKQVEAMYWRLKETFGVQHDIRLTVDKLNRKFEQALEEDESWKLGKNSLPIAAVAMSAATATTRTNGGLDSVGREADTKNVAGEKGTALHNFGTSAREPYQSAKQQRNFKKSKSPPRLKEVDQKKHSAISKSSLPCPASASREKHSILDELRWATRIGTLAVSSSESLSDKTSTRALPDPAVVLPEPTDLITKDIPSELPRKM